MQSKTLSRSAVFALVAEPQRKIKHCDQPHRHQQKAEAVLCDGGQRLHIAGRLRRSVLDPGIGIPPYCILFA